MSVQCEWKILYEIFCVKSQQFIYFKRGHLQITVCVSIYKGGLQRYKGKSDLSIPTKKTMTTQKWINIRH